MTADHTDGPGWGPDNDVISQCASCTHKYSGAPGCTAFPDGIPYEILTNDFDHRQEYPTDMGCRYEASDAAADFWAGRQQG